MNSNYEAQYVSSEEKKERKKKKRHRVGYEKLEKWLEETFPNTPSGEF